MYQARFHKMCYFYIRFNNTLFMFCKMKKIGIYFRMCCCSLLALAAVSGVACAQNASQPEVGGGKTLPKVYMFKEINAGNLVKIYKALGREATSKVAVKLSTGEPGGHNFLDPDLIKDLVQKVNGTIVECNTAYGGGRTNAADHMRAAEEHGFTAIADVDMNYDFTVVLSHFKGHAMGGFGGAIKNISIGIASANGKAWIHSAGKTKDPNTMWGNLPEQDDFLESMAEAAKAVVDHCGEHILYISVANNLSVDCDCDSSPEDPKMGDIGILASLDPVALDKACTDLVRSSEDHGKIHLIERIDSRHGMHTLDYAEQLGMGSQKYELIRLD